jgi:hypothetical protein
VFWWSTGGRNEGGLFLGFHSSQTLSCPIIHCTLPNVHMSCAIMLLLDAYRMWLAHDIYRSVLAYYITLSTNVSREEMVAVKFIVNYMALRVNL